MTYEEKINKWLSDFPAGETNPVSEEYKQKNPTFMDIAKNYMLKDWTIQFNRDETKIVKLCQQFINSINAESNTPQAVHSFVSEFELECED
jgi:hypothetical protein